MTGNIWRGSERTTLYYIQDVVLTPYIKRHYDTNEIYKGDETKEKHADRIYRYIKCTVWSIPSSHNIIILINS